MMVGWRSKRKGLESQVVCCRRHADDEGLQKIALAGAVERGVRNAMSPAGTFETCRPDLTMSVFEGKADFPVGRLDFSD